MKPADIVSDYANVILDSFEPAIQALQAKLMQWEVDHGRTWTEVKVYTYWNFGLRVSEVSYMNQTEYGMCGCSSMRNDGQPTNQQLILACEEFLVTHHIEPYRPEGWESDMDEHGDAVYMLEHTLQQAETEIAKAGPDEPSPN